MTLSIPQPPFHLRSQTLGALPILCRFLGRMRVGGLLERYLPAQDPRVALPAAATIGVLVRNLCLAHQPLYRLSEWAAPFDCSLLGLRAGEPALLNDDRVGRALDRLFACDRASLLTELMLGVIAEFNVDCSQLHNDSTSITLHGEYRRADGRARDGKTTVRIAHGHNKDHRPDLKQLLWILTISADQALPLAYRLTDGNLNDDKTHIETWDALRALTGRADFLYVADCKLATREQMGHIDAHGGRFVTVLPAGRTDARWLRDWSSEQPPQWTEAQRHPAASRGAPDAVWSTASVPIRSTEGYRLIWVHSTQQQHLDHQFRARSASTARTPRWRRSTQRLHGPQMPVPLTPRQRPSRRRHPARPAPRPQHLITIQIIDRPAQSATKHPAATRRANATANASCAPASHLTSHTNQPALARDAATDGCFPLITNDHQLTNPELLAAYRYQPNLEKRHHQLKTIHHATPVHLKTPARIEALFLCHYIALLTNALIERQLRHTMTHHHINQLPLYPEHRACQHPTATRTLELFNNLTRHHLTHNHQPIQTFPPHITPLQTQLLHLLNTPTTAYTT